ncbi:MAG: PEP-CTERM system histidine kinase PrsK, partial [Novosphingobium sp.]|nr:PEP-CTERM system histidine kinase PrsK [Novosphingobium sp.]
MNAMGSSLLLAQLASGAHFIGASVGAVLVVWLWPRRERFGAASSAILAGLLLTAAWSLTVAALGTASLPARLAEATRNLVWLFALYRLFASDGRHHSVAPIRPLVLAIAFVQLLQPGLAVVAMNGRVADRPADVLFHLSAMFSLIVTVGGLVLVHNLMTGAAGPARRALRWPAAALALLWGFDLNFYTIAYLASRWPGELASVRGICGGVVAGLIALGAARESEQLRFRPSRAVAFQSVSLLLIGGYLMVMVGGAQWLAYAGGDFALVLQYGFLVAALVVAVLVFSSGQLRGWLRVTLTKHLFQHRYDYRAAWLGFTQTMGRAGPAAPPLEQRVIQALADI